METSIHVEPASREDMPQCVRIMNAAFAFVPVIRLVHGDETPDNVARIGEAHWQAQDYHNTRFPSAPVCVKCVQTTTTPGGGGATETKIVGYGEWYIYDRARTREELHTPNYIESFAWVPRDEDRAACVAFGAPGNAVRRRTMGTAPYGQVRFLCVDPAHQKQGVGSAIMRWGMDRCGELGVPAYLESSDQGAAMYERLGFVRMETLEGEVPAHYAPMVWTPRAP